MDYAKIIEELDVSVKQLTVNNNKLIRAISVLREQDQKRGKQILELQESIGGMETLFRQVFGDDATDLHIALEKSEVVKTIRKLLQGKTVEGLPEEEEKEKEA